MAGEYIYGAEVVRIIDGDTIRLKVTKNFVFEVDFGFYIKETVTTAKSTESNFRLYGIDTPEIRGVSVEEKAKGAAATEELRRLVSLGPIKVRTYKPDKYGRWLATLFVFPPEQDPININESLVEGGYAVEYMKK